MKKETQRTNNPYKYSDTNKRYQTFDYYLRSLFGEKCAKISLDAGFTCPNIDGTLSRGGCIYCSGGSSGAECEGSLAEQYARGREVMARKWGCKKFIPYLQAHTNTYGDPGYLREKYAEAARYPGACAVSIATRADCLGDGVLAVLEELCRVTDVFVELGLQSRYDETAKLINRCMSTEEFIRGYTSLSALPVRRCIHIINGLPGEDAEHMEETARFVASLHPEMVKIHMLYVTEGTRLAETYRGGGIKLLTKDEYVAVTARQLALLPPDTVIGRLTGDAPGDSLIAPEWTRKKVCVLNDIDKYMYANGLYQGKEYK